jgi:hypothetical protein
MLETNLEKRCISYIKSKGGIALKLNPVNCRGIPDRMILLPYGRVVFIEFKAPGKRPRGNQQYWLTRLQCMGFAAKCIDNYDLFTQFIDKETR